jgi:hypothetical protein
MMVVGALSGAGAVSFSFTLMLVCQTEIIPPFFTETNKAALEGGGATGTATTTVGSQSPQTKKQRQNAQRREALKEVKREREAQQQAALATHKRELVHARAAEPVAAVPKRTGSRFDSLG